MRRTLILTAILFLAYWFVAARGPRAVGLWEDDAIYLCTAKSLAAGTGYRHIEIPGQPLQTQYPILYPAVLALGFLLGPAYPHNLVWLLAPSAASAAGLVVLSIRYIRNVFGTDRWLTALTAALAGLSPAILSFVRFTMSDLPYGVLAMAALYVVDQKYARATEVRLQRMWLVVAAILIALSTLTRSIGATLAVALLGYLLLRRQWRHALLTGLVVAACMTPWIVRQAVAAQANGSMPPDFLIAPDQRGYVLWLPSSLGDTGCVVIQNLVRAAFGLVYFQLALPRNAVLAALAAPSGWLVGLHALSYLVLALIVVGFLSTLQPRLRLLHIYAVLYAAIVLSWPFEPYRFLIPWTPLLLYFLLRGVRSLAQRALAARRRSAMSRLAAASVWAVALFLVVCFVIDDGRIVTSTEQDYFLREFPIDWTEVRAVEQWVTQNTGTKDVLAVSCTAGLFLVTGRQGYHFWPDTNPYRLYYGRDRAWSKFYLVGSASEGQRLLDELRSRLDEVYRAAGIRYYIEHRQIDVGEGAMAEYVRARPDVFRPVFQTRRGNFTVFRVQAPP